MSYGPVVPAIPLLRTRCWPPAAGLFGLVIGGAWLTSYPATSSAQDALPIPLTLRWTAPVGCPDDEWVVREVSGLLRGEPSDARASVAAIVTVRRAGEGAWDVRMATTRQGVTGERELRADTCESAGKAVALILAIAIDPKQAAAARVMPSEATSAVPEPVASPSSPPAHSAAPAAVSSLPVAIPGASASSPTPTAPSVPAQAARPWTVGISAELDIGSLPEPALGIQLDGQRELGSWELGVYAAAWPQATGKDADGREAGGEFELYVGGVGASYSLSDGPLRWGPVASLEGGAMRGAGFGVSNPAAVWGPWLAATVGGQLSAPIVGGISIRVQSVAVFPLSRDEFVIDRVGSIHRASAIAWRTAFGLELSF